MMRYAWLLALPSIAWAVGCSTTPSNPTNASADAEADAGDVCSLDQFFDAGGSGGSCPFASPSRCFPECTTGGCFCRPGPNGAPAWKCQTDHSCEPDGCAPLADCGAPLPDAAAPVDAPFDGE